MDYKQKLEKAKNLADIFEIVKDIVMDYLGVDQAGIIVGVSDLGISLSGFVGAFYSLDANMIIINKRPLASLIQTAPSLYKNYLFHIMLHEYIHSIGSYNEQVTRQLSYDIINNYFGSDHLVTQLALGLEKFMPHFMHPGVLQMPQDTNIEFVKGIDRKNINYIN